MNRTRDVEMNDRICSLAQTVWDYHVLNHTIEKSDAIVVLCSHDPRVAERGAGLFLEGMAPLLVLRDNCQLLGTCYFPSLRLFPHPANIINEIFIRGKI